MDSSKPTYSCPSCDKIYLSQHSLTRHSHNHKEASRHICPACAVVFSRKDLLNRHLKMVHDPVRGGSRPGRRARCHTACLNCRDARIKCDSNQPCASCSALGKTCHYSSKTARVSRTTHVEMDERLPDEENEIENEPENSPVIVGHQVDQSFHLASLNSQNLANFSTGLPDDLQLSMLPHANALDGMNFYDSSPSHMVAWPWLHEDLFLQNGDGLAAYDLGAIDLQSLSQIDAIPGLLDVDQIGPGSSSLQTGDFASQANNSLVDISQSGISQWNANNPPGSEPQVGLSESSRLTPHGEVNRSTLPLMRETTENPQRSLGSSRVTDDQLTVVVELVAYARQVCLETHASNHHVTFWYSMSMRVREAFNIYSGESPNTSVIHYLDHMVSLFRDNFWTLWPMIPAYSFNVNNISPVLYLAICSIGAMYGGSKASHFGVLLHEGLRELLCEPLLDSDEVDPAPLSLAQARLLTQVAALYFGQKRAFTYAQHLGSVLIAQTRRMDLFSAPRYRKDLLHVPTSTQESPELSKWLSRWLLAESRKRLAFGILRAEVYTSVLLNARPMLCADELALELPCSNYLWLTRFKSDSQYVTAIRQDALSHDYEKLHFDDVVKITMERAEPMPPLNILSRELLIFGLQEHVWRTCHDPDLLSRLTSSQADLDDCYNGLEGSFNIQEDSGNLQRSRTLSSAAVSHSLESQVMGRKRQMLDLRTERTKTANALKRWRQSLNHHNGSDFSRGDRTSLLSGLLLFHVSFLRMYAPIEQLHHISYRIGGSSSSSSSLDSLPDADIIRSAWEWSRRSRYAKTAVRHACIIWSLLSEECNRRRRDEEQDNTYHDGDHERHHHRASFNFLALLSLHHAAVVIWAYAGTHHENGGFGSGDDTEGDEHQDGATGGEESSSDTEIEFGDMGNNNNNRFRITSSTSRQLMTLFVQLYGNISPAWSVRGSFSATAARLASHAFPSLPLVG